MKWLGIKINVGFVWSFCSSDVERTALKHFFKLLPQRSCFWAYNRRISTFMTSCWIFGKLLSNNSLDPFKRSRNLKLAQSSVSWREFTSVEKLCSFWKRRELCFLFSGWILMARLPLCTGADETKRRFSVEEVHAFSWRNVE